LDRQSYSRRLLGFNLDAIASLFSFPAPDKRRSLYIFIKISRDL